MQVIALIAAEILLLLIVALGVCVERRVTRLELARGKQVSRLRELRLELEALKRYTSSGEENETTDVETRRAKDAERRFTEGVASILGYGLRAARLEAEHGEDTGA